MKNATVRKYFDLGNFFESPKNRGRPPRILDELLEASNINVTRMQDSSDMGKSDNSTMMATIDVMVQGTGFESLFATEWCCSRVRRYYPETLVHTAMFDHKYRCTEWLTLNNTNHWIDGTKQILIDLRFVKGEPCTFPGK